MEERYENLQPARIRRLGFVLLALFAFLMLANNRAIYPLLDAGGPSNWYQGIFAAMCGVIFAQFSLLAVWSVLSPQPLLRRLLFLICAAVALTAAWTLGFVASRYPGPYESIKWLETEEVFVFGFVPIVFLAHALPLIGLRFFSSAVLTQNDQLPQRRSVSIAGLLAATGTVAIVLAAIQFPTQMGLSQAEAWAIAGVGAGIAFAIGLLSVLPAVILLFSRRRFYWVWSIVLTIYAAGITGAIFGGLRSFQLSPAGSTWIFVVLATTEMVAMAAGIGILRMLGYRLGKATADQKKSPVK